MAINQCQSELKLGQECLWFYTRGPLFPLHLLSMLWEFFFLFLGLGFLFPVCLPPPAFLWTLSTFQVLMPDPIEP